MKATMTVLELCELLGRSKKTVVKAMRAGELPGHQLFGKRGPWVIPREAVERYLRGEWRPTAHPAPPAVTPFVARRSA